MKSPRPRGRPNQGLAESPVRVGFTAALLSLVDAAARKEGVSRPEWIRRACLAQMLVKGMPSQGQVRLSLTGGKPNQTGT